MQFAVVCLDIDEEGVRHADDLLQIFLGHGEAGVHRRVDARRMQRGEQFAAEIRLQKRFAARQRDAAAPVRLAVDAGCGVTQSASVAEKSGAGLSDGYARSCAMISASARDAKAAICFKTAA